MKCSFQKNNTQSFFHVYTDSLRHFTATLKCKFKSSRSGTMTAMVLFKWTKTCLASLYLGLHINGLQQLISMSTVNYLKKSTAELHIVELFEAVAKLNMLFHLFKSQSTRKCNLKMRKTQMRSGKAVMKTKKTKNTIISNERVRTIGNQSLLRNLPRVLLRMYS